MSGFLTRFAALSLLIALLALPAAAADAAPRSALWARVAHQVDAAIDHVLALLWPRATDARGGEPEAFCNDVDPLGCAESSPRVAPAGDADAFCNTIDPDGCATSAEESSGGDAPTDPPRLPAGA